MHKRHGEHPFSFRISFNVPDLEALRGKKACEEKFLNVAFSVSQHGLVISIPGRDKSWTHPPLLVLFPCNYDHLSFNESQFVIVVSLAVVDSLHPAGFAFSLDTQIASLSSFLNFLKTSSSQNLIKEIGHIKQGQHIKAVQNRSLIQTIPTKSEIKMDE